MNRDALDKTLSFFLLPPPSVHLSRLPGTMQTEYPIVSRQPATVLASEIRKRRHRKSSFSAGVLIKRKPEYRAVVRCAWTNNERNWTPVGVRQVVRYASTLNYTNKRRSEIIGCSFHILIEVYL